MYDHTYESVIAGMNHTSFHIQIRYTCCNFNNNNLSIGIIFTVCI